MLHTNKNNEPSALISNVQRYTIHDGPGIRTSLFFVGCSMHCIWCSNPETIEMRQRLGYYPAKCIAIEKCGRCVKICPETDILNFNSDGFLIGGTQKKTCENCFKCAEVCPPRAIKVWGEYMTIPEMMKAILEDRSFYDRTGGGVTLNGGEVMLQWEIAEMLLHECKSTSINTCVETALHCPWENAKVVFEYTDCIIADIKHMDSKKHREITGAGNELILDNIVKAAELGKKLVIRTPIVPGFNADEENIRKTGEFIRDKLLGNIAAYQLLPFRKLGTEKYESLGERYPMEDIVMPERSVWEENLMNLAEILRRDYGIPAVAGSSEKLEI